MKSKDDKGYIDWGIGFPDFIIGAILASGLFCIVVKFFAFRLNAFEDICLWIFIFTHLMGCGHKKVYIINKGESK